ncbi:MAG: phospho-sugar mutase [Clostridiales Family XIII bacterium]|jgi:phosphoglucomutase|nr:phospho-sugar mutase [Clostridiales Family XIII bacterium]
MNENIIKLKSWLAVDDLDPAVRKELEDAYDAYEKDPSEDNLTAISDRFYRDLEFGTGGIRGIVGAGANRINVHTIRKISQGFANEIVKKDTEEPSVVISYDNRRGSDVFAFESACVFLANGLRVYLFERLSPTPLLSFAVRELGCTAGVMVTASHNPKQYNGYKIYDSDGCQYLPEEATAVANAINSLDIWKGVKTVAGDYEGDLQTKIQALADGPAKFDIVPQTVEDKFIELVLAQRLSPDAFEDVHVVYTPLHGTGNIPVRKTLTKAGIGGLEIVKEQEYPDPEFTNAPEPNPEKKVALNLGIEKAKSLNAAGQHIDALLATDPDADRVGVAVLQNGDYQILTGNEIGILIFDYIVSTRKKLGTMPGQPVLVTTIVSSPMVSVIAQAEGVDVKKVLTGFKFIGEQITALEKAGELERYVFGFEESCGYLSGTYARDKDAVNACLLISEMIGVYKKQGKTIVDRLEELYKTYGYYIDITDELVRPGEKGMHEITAIMDSLRSPDAKYGFTTEIERFFDYRRGTVQIRGHQETTPITGIPVAEVLEFDLLDGTRVLARPSGTEPKLKIYYSALGKSPVEATASLETLRQEVSKIANL